MIRSALLLISPHRAHVRRIELVLLARAWASLHCVRASAGAGNTAGPIIIIIAAAVGGGVALVILVVVLVVVLRRRNANAAPAVALNVM